MNDNPRFVSTFLKFLQQWPELFEGVDKGGDIGAWVNLAEKLFLPAMVFGPDSPEGAIVGVAVPADEDVLLALPCAFDDDPLTGSQYGQGKVKFHGKARSGVLAITDRSVSFVHEIASRHPIGLSVGSFQRKDVATLNSLSFKFSKLSMTAAGPGCELLFQRPDGTSNRLLFRMALTPLQGEAVVGRLRALTDGRTANGQDGQL